jgi:hypothetical protein
MDVGYNPGHETAVKVLKAFVRVLSYISGYHLQKASGQGAMKQAATRALSLCPRLQCASVSCDVILACTYGTKGRLAAIPVTRALGLIHMNRVSVSS